MAVTLEQINIISAGDVRTGGIDYTPDLGDAEVISTVSVAEVTTTDLSFSGEAVLSAEEEILNRTVAIGKGVKFSISGAAAGTNYRLRVTVTTSYGDTWNHDLILMCVG